MRKKGYTLSFEERDDLLLVRAAGGKRSRANVIAMTVEIFQAGVARGKSKVLVDVAALEGSLATGDSYDLVTEVFDGLRAKGLRKAAMVDKPSHLRGDNFFETVARNRGFDLRVFDSRELALEWLGR